MHLTDISIRALNPPEAGAKTYFDDSLSGFGVRISQGGTRTFILVHGRARTRIKIGSVGILTLKQAREKARDILAEKQLGRYQAPTVLFGDALDLYFSTHVDNLKPKTAHETKRLLEKHFRPRLRHERLDQITRAAVAAMVHSLLKTPSTALHAHTAITGFFRWASAQYLEQNPLNGLKPPWRQTSRSRVLSNEELQAVLKVCLYPKDVSERFATIVLMLLLTGQRVNQIASLRGEWVDRETEIITFPLQVMKGNREHVLPHGKWVTGLLRDLPKTGLLFPARGRETPFNGFSKCKEDFDAACGVKDWTLHDLRRTLRTNLAALRVPREIGERILDHRSAVATEVEAIYDRFSYIDEMRDALSQWEKKVVSLVPVG